MGFVKRTSFLSQKAQGAYKDWYDASMQCHNWEMAHRGPRDEGYHQALIAKTTTLEKDFDKIDDNDERLKRLGQLPADKAKAEKKSEASTPLVFKKQEQKQVAENGLETENSIAMATAQNPNKINPNVLFASTQKAFNPNNALGNVMDFMC